MKTTFKSSVLSTIILTLICLTLHSDEGLKPLATSPAPKVDSPWAQKYWYPTHEKLLNESRSQKDDAIDLLFIGDSITAGFNGKEGKAALKENFPHLSYHNVAVKGDTTSNVLWRIKEGVIDNLKPKITVLMIGTNNTSADYLPQETANGIEAILNQIKIKLPHSKILLLSVLPRGERGKRKFATCNKNINKIILNYENKENIFYLDLSEAFQTTDEEFNQDYYNRDQLHLNGKGYHVWAKTMKPTITNLMTNYSLKVNSVPQVD